MDEQFAKMAELARLPTSNFVSKMTMTAATTMGWVFDFLTAGKRSDVGARPICLSKTVAVPRPFHAVFTILLLLCCVGGGSSSDVATNSDDRLCYRNLCMLQSIYCVETCPLNQRNAYFSYGLRSNNRCIPNPPSAKAAITQVGLNDTSARLAPVNMQGFDEAEFDQPGALAQRQELWPEFPPPTCTRGICRFEGPTCISWCSQDYVYYGPNRLCRRASQAGTG